uniref:BTB domain-containing protein n=1 Tax=Parascaris equorum TaxID=6256 RepID=A0A914RBW0_PAREQ
MASIVSFSDRALILEASSHEFIHIMIHQCIDGDLKKRRQVSSDILRLSGYSNQFRTLLTGKSVPRRESGPGALLQDFSDSK